MILFVLVTSATYDGVGFAQTTEESSQELGICLTDSLTGRERKQLAQWIFFGMAAHSDLNSFTNITDADKTQNDQSTGKIITRIVTEDCRSLVIEAIELGGSLAMQSAFEFVGSVAMLELMTDQNVMATLGGYEKFLDEKKFDTLLSSDTPGN